MSTNELERELFHDEQTAKRIDMIAKAMRRREQRARTLRRRGERFAKFALQGRL